MPSAGWYRLDNGRRACSAGAQAPVPVWSVPGLARRRTALRRLRRAILTATGSVQPAAALAAVRHPPSPPCPHDAGRVPGRRRLRDPHFPSAGRPDYIAAPTDRSDFTWWPTYRALTRAMMLFVAASCTPTTPSYDGLRSLRGILPRISSGHRLIETEYSWYYTVGPPNGTRTITATVTNVLADTLVVQPCGIAINVLSRVSDGERWRPLEGLSCPFSGTKRVLAPGTRLRTDVTLQSSAPGTYVLEIAAAWRCSAPSATERSPQSDIEHIDRPVLGGHDQDARGGPACILGDSITFEDRVSQPFRLF